MKDTARHYHRPRKQLSHNAKVGIILAGSVVGFAILVCTSQWYNRKHPRPQVNCAVGRGEVVQLENVIEGVSRVEEEDGDHPPKYARVGMPGEVPPGYDNILNSDTGREANGQELDPTPVTTTTDFVAPVPKKREFWRSMWSSIFR